MAIRNSVTQNHKTNIIIITGNDETLENLLSVIQKSEKSHELTNVTRRRIVESDNDKTKASCKRRKTDLTCVICEDKCSGYNFNVISCGSCKSFFHRNASQNVHNLQCLTGTNNCDIKFKSRRRICRRCRLRKCLSVGMKWNASAEEEKLNKQRQREENRRFTKNATATLVQRNSTDVSFEENEQLLHESVIVSESEKSTPMEHLQSTQLSPVQQTVPFIQNFYLTSDDYSRINAIKFAYEHAFRLTTIKRDVSVFDSITDQRSMLLHSAAVSYDIGMKLITFIRSIPEFELLDERDRFTLVKYNSPLVFFMRLCLIYNKDKDFVFDSELETEEYASTCKQLSYYCYGEQLYLQTNQLFRSIKELTDPDPVILQLMMVILVFVKGVSVEDIVATQESVLVNNKQVYEAQSIYTSLLFRYMIEKQPTYDQAVRQYSRLIEKTIQLQMCARAHQKFLEEQLVNTTDEEIHPVIKSILRLH